MPATLKTIHHDADQTISVYGPLVASKISKDRIRRHLGMIFKPLSAHAGFECSLTLSDEPSATFQTEAEAIEYFLKHT